MGQPLEYALCSCVLAMRLGEALKLFVSLFTRFIRQANADASPLQLARFMAQGILSMPHIKNSRRESASSTNAKESRL
jgi:hypothetical protein